MRCLPNPRWRVRRRRLTTTGIVRTADELRAMIAEIRRYPEFCFDTETTGFDLFNDRIVGMSFAVVPHEAWYVPCDERSTPEYAGLLRP